jgi:aerotaxis receptor
MRLNLPITGHELDYSSEQMLVSVTDTKGFITHCNRAFVAVSGYTFEELIGENHNLIRHPDMPAVGFKDLWSTIGRGKPWTGLVKNRAKNGDHYWVVANVTPIMAGKKPQAYLSVRTKPTRAQIDATDALYKTINATADLSTLPLYLKEGVIYQKGVRGIPDWFASLSMTIRLGIALGFMAAFGMLPEWLDLHGVAAIAARWGALTLGAIGVVVWFNQRFSRAFAEAQQFANDLAGCNLTTSTGSDFPHPMGGLVRSLKQIQINLQAVVGDVRVEIGNFTQSAKEIADGGMDLSERTESQAQSLQETSSSMDNLSETVRRTAEVAAQVADQSNRSTDVAQAGGVAVHQVGQIMSAIDASSSKVQEIIGVIEGIAFQTNILALNAAVEAARAGEQGRGFAVVASEVRALAQRSAKAAKEIRDLISHTTDQISDGTQQMGSAASTIDQVVQSVREVGQLIASISQATQQQASGIDQVNQAVSQLDTVTQQNAALVEQSAAAAEDLNTSGIMLTRAAQVFQLP